MKVAEIGAGASGTSTIVDPVSPTATREPRYSPSTEDPLALDPLSPDPLSPIETRPIGDSSVSVGR